MGRKPCKVCGAIQGPSIYADKDACSVWCDKVLKGEMSREDWKKRTGRRLLDG